MTRVNVNGKEAWKLERAGNWPRMIEVVHGLMNKALFVSKSN